MSGNSYRPQVSLRRRTFSRLVGDIHQELARVMTKKPSVTKAEIARRLGVDRSLVTRRLNGTSNMTLETLADLAWAMDQKIEIRLSDRAKTAFSNSATATTDQTRTHVTVCRGIGGSGETWRTTVSPQTYSHSQPWAASA